MALLAPTDFVAAGQACYKWRAATWNQTLLSAQLRRLGWSDIKWDVNTQRNILSREISLSPSVAAPTDCPDHACKSPFRKVTEASILPTKSQLMASRPDSSRDTSTWHISECSYYLIVSQGTAFCVQRLYSDGMQMVAIIDSGPSHSLCRRMTDSLYHDVQDHEYPYRHPQTFITTDAIWCIQPLGQHKHFLTDRRHVLALDPESKLLAMCTQPIFGGPSKLNLIFLFVPPDEPGQDGETILPGPTCFKAAAHLDHGVRIVAVYGDFVVLFSVSVDALAASPASPAPRANTRQQDNNSSTGSVESSTDVADTSDKAQKDGRPEWLEWWPEVCGNYSLTKLKEDSLPLPIQGRIVGRLPGIADMAIQVHTSKESDAMSGISTWAFCEDGRAVCWTAGSYND
ncbi:hypothetical protein B9Z65_7213 [Elsinoe australis]|uniref:Uncharacterized protein n=1 Tax=Elsinoe australis TaxID=40998 RepID=A0A2P7Z678_9PEZI|nr:hypothetical protein B9Z65_7213 [Elsinoe australis]